MIIVGYYGIGKSTAATKSPGIIDLESKYFRDRKDDLNWLGGKRGVRNYIWMASDLNKAGKIVLLSCDKEVRAELLSRKDIKQRDIIYICPNVEDKDSWMGLLYKRWQNSTEAKDWYAYTRASKNFEDDIKSMSNDNVRIDRITREEVEEGLYSFLVKKGIV